MKIKRNSLPDLLLTAVFPRRCKYCGEVIRDDEFICDSCAVLPEIKPPICLKCGCSKADCVCKKKSHFYDRAAAPYYYEGAISYAVTRMKFHNLGFLAKDFAEDMQLACENVLNMKERLYDCIAYIPFSEKQERNRLYNPSRLLAESLSERTGIELADLLVKIYETQPQHNASSVTRKGNVFGVYDVSDEYDVEGKNILLVDDVKTSGATLDECAKVLKIHGAEIVDCISFAITKSKEDIDIDS